LFLSNQYGRLTEKNRVWSAYFNYLVTLASSRQPIDQNARAADGNNTADMWLHAIDQWTSMEIRSGSPSGFVTDQDVDTANAWR
jgi:hypothetical protein